MPHPYIYFVSVIIVGGLGGVRADEVEDAGPGVGGFVGVFGEFAVEEGVRSAGIDDDFVGDVGGGEVLVELVDLLLGDALVGSAVEAEDGDADLGGAVEGA